MSTGGADTAVMVWARQSSQDRGGVQGDSDDSDTDSEEEGRTFFSWEGIVSCHTLFLLCVFSFSFFFHLLLFEAEIIVYIFYISLFSVFLTYTQHLHLYVMSSLCVVEEILFTDVLSCTLRHGFDHTCF